MAMKAFRKNTLQFAKTVFPFHAAAWKASSEPMRRMLEERDVARKDELTASWKESTQTQLNIISVTVCTNLDVYAVHSSQTTFTRVHSSAQ